MSYVYAIYFVHYLKVQFNPSVYSVIRERESMVIEKGGNKKISEPSQRGCPAKVHNTFAGHPYFVENWEIASNHKRRDCRLVWINCWEKGSQFGQTAEIYVEERKWFLIGTGFSYLTVILPAVEPMAEGERG